MTVVGVPIRSPHTILTGKTQSILTYNIVVAVKYWAPDDYYLVEWKTPGLCFVAMEQE
jgi:hypothetical protein